MTIDLLYVRDCPNRGLARDHLDAALARTRLAAVVREHEVHSSEEAEHLGMRGSPTILIDGRDPFAGTAAPAALSCRLYRSGQSGVPTVSQLVDHLERWVDDRAGAGTVMTIDEVAELGKEGWAGCR